MENDKWTPKDTLVTILIIGVTFCSMWFPTTQFRVMDYTTVLINPTEEQVLSLYKASSEEDRFWVREIHAVKGENSILEASIGVRFSEGEDKIKETLNELGVDYYIVPK